MRIVLAKDITAEREAARERVDTAALAEQAAVTGGKGELYAAKLAQAERVIAGGAVDAAEVPMIAAEAELDGVEMADVAMVVAINAYEAGKSIAAIETRRLVANRAIEAAADPNAIAAAEAAFAATDKAGS